MPENTNATRRLEDIALDLMKFVAVTTSYGKPGSGAGFQSKADKTGEDYADSLLKLYERCRTAVGKS